MSIFTCEWEGLGTDTGHMIKQDGHCYNVVEVDLITYL